MGKRPTSCPVIGKLDNPEHRAFIAKVWGVAEEDLPKPGRSAYEMLDAMGCDGGVRALLVFGSNLAVSAPRAGHIEKRLDALDFLMVSDFFLSETAERADVVLPAAQWAEEEGTMTNLEGRVIYAPASDASAPEAFEPIWRCCRLLAQRLGYGASFPSRAARRSSKNCGARRQAAQRTMRASPTSGSSAKTACSGRARARIIRARRGCSWIASPPQTAGRDFIPWSISLPAEEPDHEFPLYLTTGRIMAQYQSGTQTRRVAALMQSRRRRRSCRFIRPWRARMESAKGSRFA